MLFSAGLDALTRKETAMSEVLLIEETENKQGFGDRFRSRPRKIAKWLLESRDNWKNKHQNLKVLLKRFQVQLADVRKSRKQWRERAQYSLKELEQMKAEVQQLRKQVEQSDQGELKKN